MALFLSLSNRYVTTSYNATYSYYIFPNGYFKKSLQVAQMDPSGRWKKEIIEENYRIFRMFLYASLIAGLLFFSESRWSWLQCALESHQTWHEVSFLAQRPKELSFSKKCTISAS